ncbi:IPT/TIG domain-containing protein [Humibacter albus]|uniref:IPT/TIG domain-containing protein n=1 Tax=Humibacter albus TaxID=427754 RepID=UPI0003B58C33|nr:IPT/TIG domain-containing protein [Humibacter albus]
MTESASSARFLSGSLLTSGGLLDDVATLQGVSASNSGSTTPDTETGSLDLSVLNSLNVSLPSGVDVPLGEFLQLGAVNQYAQASNLGVSRAASGAVSDDGAVSLSGSAGFPANASIDLVDLLGSTANGVLDTGKLNIGAVTGVAALNAPTATPATACADLSSPAGCRDYNVASAGLNLSSPLVGNAVGEINSTLDSTSSTVNDLAATLQNSIITQVSNLLSTLTGPSNVAVTLNVDLRSALSTVLSGTLSQGGVTLDLSNGAITVDLATVIGGLNGQAPDTPLLSVTVMNSIVSDLGGILTQLQTNVNSTVSTALNGATVGINATFCGIGGCDPGVTSGQLTIGYNGTLQDLASKTAAISVTGTGLVPGLLQLLVTPLSTTLATVLGDAASPVLSNAISGVASTVSTQVTSLNKNLDPVLSAIGTVVGANLNVQEAGSTAGSFREVAVRVSVLGSSAATVDLGRAEVGPNAVATPSITSLDPTHGPQAGGTSVTITGTGFTGATGVTFGGTSAAYTVVDDSHITVTSPAHDPGAVDVVVQGPGGSSGPGTFTFDPAASVTGISPDHGPQDGGTNVTITGSGFTKATAATFDGTDGTAFTVVDDSHITVATPAHDPGAVDVVVDSPDGDSAPVTFTYTPGTAVTGVDPATGPEAGGTVVTITGQCFTGADDVLFGGVSAAAFTVDGDTQITATAPAGTGTVDVTVIGSSDCGTGTDADAYTYEAAPTIQSLTPSEGPVAGGTTVTITGTGFTGATAVTFGGETATGFSVDSPTQITVVTPAHDAGTVDVIVLSPYGDATAPQAYTYIAAPTVGTFSPVQGPTAGGTTVTISGDNLTGTTAVAFGGSAAASFSVENDNEITAVTPAHDAGQVDVTVTTPGGVSHLGPFTFVPPAAITSLDPATGPETGGTTVTLTGSGFTNATAVTFDGTDGGSFTVVSDTQITVTTPPHAVGDVDVVVDSPYGNSPAGTFTYTPVTTITAVDPGSGPEAGGNTVTITGHCFAAATQVFFGATPATSFTVVSDTEITAVVPAGVGTVDVSVAGGGSCGTGTAPGGYEYIAPPSISSLAPTSGPQTGGTAVTITGSGFTGASGVTFDGTAGTDFTVVNDTRITVTTPEHDPGDAAVVVDSPNGNSDPATFTYTPVTQITGVQPATGPEAGGNAVTITGQCFTGATEVQFGGTSAHFTVDGDTQITAIAPAGTGTVDVTVVGAAGCGTATDDGAYTYKPAASIQSLTPAEGPTSGGTTVTITGSEFTAATGVTFDGDAGTAFTVVDDSHITVTTPAHVAGAVDVAVLSPYGNGTSADAFTYVAAPTIASVSPEQGPTAGGTTVTITGTGFAGAGAVQFGGAAAAAYTVDSDTQITATTPAHDAGHVDVTVNTVGGTSQAGAFTFVPPAAVTSLDPVTGPETGGTPVTVTGSGFTNATAVTFDGVDGGSFVVVSDTQITVLTPPHAVGDVDVVVDSPYGNGAAGTFTYTPVTTITGTQPGEGPEDGGTSVTITGHCFAAATQVFFGATPATSFTVVSDTEITAVSPAGVGTVDVTVIGAGTCGTATDPGGFTYLPNTNPVITGLTPVRGPETGGTVVTITGTNFTGATGATFDGIPGTSFTVDSDTQITVTSPAHKPSTVDVIVDGAAAPVSSTGPTGPSGPIHPVMLLLAAPSAQSNAGAFTYYAVSDVDGVDPGSGPAGGGNTVTISGKCFTGATQVLFGSAKATTFTVVDDTTIKAVVPAGAGAVDVTVVGAGDCGTSTLANGYRYMTPVQSLAATGVDALGLTGLLLALGLLAGGLSLLVTRRRRREA